MGVSDDAADAADHVVGIVLGAGSSRRLGRPKQTLPFGDSTLLGWTVRGVEQSGLDRVVVVLGGAAQESRSGLDPTRASVVLNDDHRSGCASSLQAGLDEAGPCRAIMIILGDMPGVDARVVDHVLAAWRRNPSWAAVTSYRDRLGHPIVVSAEGFPTLRTLHGDKAVWKIIDREPEERVPRIAVDQVCPGDVDTWQDYEDVGQELGVAIDPAVDRAPAEGAS